MRKVMILGLFLWMGLAGLAWPQEGSLRFEKTVSWTTAKLLDLNATVGPVRIGKVEFSNQGKGGGSIASRFRGGASDTQTKEDEWVVTFTLEFLDRNGKLIDRATGKQGFEGEARTVNVDHSILEYVVPMIDKVRIKMEAKLE